jgi:hypothetical protein
MRSSPDHRSSARSQPHATITAVLAPAQACVSHSASAIRDPGRRSNCSADSEVHLRHRHARSTVMWSGYASIADADFAYRQRLLRTRSRNTNWLVREPVLTKVRAAFPASQHCHVILAGLDR